MTPQQVLAVVGEYSARGFPPKPEVFWQSMENKSIDQLTPEHLEVIEQAGLIHLLSELLHEQRSRQNSKS